jgi:hypothetical protein
VGVRASEGIQQTGQTVISTVFDKNTIVYDRIRSVFSMDKVVYGTAYDRKGPFTESITIDLGQNLLQNQQIQLKMKMMKKK